jgi:uncharacterized protein (DUF697 family)/tellurite resistance protein
MQESEHRAITTLALIAALADGRRQAEEDFELQRIADAMGGEHDYGAIARRVLAGTIRLNEVTATLSTPEGRRSAYEAAVVVCNADGPPNDAEKGFLAELRQSLGLEGSTATLDAAARDLGAAPPAGSLLQAAPSPRAEGPRPSQAGIPAISADTVLDDLILNTAMTAAALELLPQGLASLAIIPVQARMVYRIGADFGHELDRLRIGDLAAAMGIGAVGQVFEGTARRLFGGLARGALGGVAGGVAGAATSAALTFATTYALGHAAKQYYAQGRSLSRADLQALVGRLRTEAGELYPRVESRIRELAGTLDLNDVVGRFRV